MAKSKEAAMVASEMASKRAKNKRLRGESGAAISASEREVADRPAKKKMNALLKRFRDKVGGAASAKERKLFVMDELRKSSGAAVSKSEINAALKQLK
ncbi:hypothetical protein GOV11_04240 [Candidatus Woesearchaeota archaeon]|nr:hypothetical protein [Candidatus Woesearchaeota archaeon]